MDKSSSSPESEASADSLTDAQMQRLVEWDESFANGTTSIMHGSTDMTMDDGLTRQIRCMQLLRQSRQLHFHSQSNGLLGSNMLSPLRNDFASSATLPPTMPTQFGRFEIREEIGRGGYGIVFLAFEQTTGREVALKIPNSTAILREELLERFQNEAKAAGVLDHPNIVQVYDAGNIGPVHYIASAYCPGISLHDWLTQRSDEVSQTDASKLVMCLANAIQHANERGVFHRDLKPANVLLQPLELPDSTESNLSRRAHVIDFTRRSPLAKLTPKITDFGLAKLAEVDATLSGSVMGTPAYMAPEQASGQSKASTSRVDVYSLGAILYELLAGKAPFEGDSSWEILRRVMNESPKSLHVQRKHLAKDLEIICMKSLEKDPAHRYATAGELAEDLQRFLNNEPILARKANSFELLVKLCRRKPLAMSLVAALVCAVISSLAIVSYLWSHSDFQRLKAEKALVDLQRANEAARIQRELGERLFYLNRISLAEKESLINRTRARDELAKCDEGYRDWEWDYLWKQCHPEMWEMAGTNNRLAGVVSALMAS